MTLRQRVRLWMSTGRSSPLCPHCAGRLVFVQDVLLGPSAVAVPAEIWRCMRCGKETEL